MLQSRLVHGVCEVPGCQDETHVNAFQYVIVPTPSGTWRAHGVSSEAKLQLTIEKTKYFSVNLRMFSGVEVELGAVDDVLPHDVGSGANGDEWVKIGECHPDAEDGVFLAKTLCS